MSGGPRLRLLPAPEDRDPDSARPSDNRRDSNATSGALRSPGPAPLALARGLRVGEPVVWWGEKDRVDRKPILWILTIGLVLLGLASLLAPDLWQRPLAELWQLIVPVLAPAALLFARELVSICAVLVTDSSVLVLDHRGRLERLAFRNVRRVRRDWLTGGVLLEGAAHKVRVPPQLMEDTRSAITSQTRFVIASGQRPDDPLRFLG